MAATNPASETNLPLIAISAGTQLPMKLTSTNYASWRAQFMSLLIEYDLKGFIDGMNPCPPKEITRDNQTVPNATRIHWIRQDQLLLNGIFASTSEAIIPLIASYATSQIAWNKLATLYASKSRSRVMHLKDQLSTIKRYSRSISDFLQQLKSIVDELAMIDSPLHDDDLVIHALRGLGSEYREIAAAIRARENTITFEELYDKLAAHEMFLQHEETAVKVLPVTANFSTRNISMAQF